MNKIKKSINNSPQPHATFNTFEALWMNRPTIAFDTLGDVDGLGAHKALGRCDLRIYYN